MRCFSYLDAVASDPCDVGTAVRLGRADARGTPRAAPVPGASCRARARVEADVMSWFRPPTDDHPASMLRWVRRVYLVQVPAGLLVALVLWVADLGAWWLGLVVVAIALSGLATIGPSIRRAQARGPNDPATRPARQRRAERLTLASFGAFTAVAVAVSLVTEGAGLAITMGLLLSLGAILGIALFRRWTDQ
jgi:hypothetical protein